MPKKIPQQIPCILLAAGTSSRFKRKDSKLIQPYKNKPLIYHITQKLLSIDIINTIFVITGHQNEIISATLENLFPKQNKIKTIFNKNYLSGMYSSLECGLNQTKNASHILITPADLPEINIKTIKKIATAHTRKKNIIAAMPMHNDTCGNPVLISQKIIPQLRLFKQINSSQKERNTGAKTFLKFIEQQNRNSISFISTNDKNILSDIDTVKQLKNLAESN